MAHPAAAQVTIGVDTHLEVHVAHAVDQLGRRLDSIQTPSTPTGSAQLLIWAQALGDPVAWAWKAPGPTVLLWPASWLPTTSW